MATTLTPRQQQIKKLLDQGKKAKQIANQLGISENAVHQHKRRMKDAGGSKPATATRSRAQSSGTKRTQSRTAATPRRPAPAPAKPAEARPVTPLQAVRHRRQEITHALKDVREEHEAAIKAVEHAREQREKAEARYADELNQLDAAERALTGELPAPTPGTLAEPIRTPAAPAKSAGKSGGRRRNGGKVAAEAAPADTGAATQLAAEPEAAEPEATAQDAAAEAPDEPLIGEERPGVPTLSEFDQPEADAAFADA